jgi:hypothetical protein
LNKITVLSKRVIASVVRGLFINKFFRLFADNASASDQLSKAVGKGLADSATASDNLSKEVGRAVTDSATATDFFSRIVAYARLFNDSAAATDLVTKSAGKGLSDSATGTDAGTVLNQDYVNSFFYFADDYVGTKRTF